MFIDPIVQQMTDHEEIIVNRPASMAFLISKHIVQKSNFDIWIYFKKYL